MTWTLGAALLETGAFSPTRSDCAATQNRFFKHSAGLGWHVMQSGPIFKFLYTGGVGKFMLELTDLQSGLYKGSQMSSRRTQTRDDLIKYSTGIYLL
ncbi:hypothetical protein GOP47_0006936 [Adiantum capillus-veneris]|uniref:Uncharacterized protein n=1 Tax=Adiantum capillus-veneris TaxID=13818 RepID=A0A9D4V168_ADICA|nr:hypothetical protein GOP47_0006936 [Adiantum capillus-veneris]